MQTANSELASGEGPTRIFVCYDRVNDDDLHEQLAEQASHPTASFEIVGRSSGTPEGDPMDGRTRRAISAADQVVVICGEASDGSSLMADELRIAQEEDRPYLLLWGRRESMCTRPTTAKATDSMYSWTFANLQDRLLALRRLATSRKRDAERAAAKLAAKEGL